MIKNRPIMYFDLFYSALIQINYTDFIFYLLKQHTLSNKSITPKH